MKLRFTKMQGAGNDFVVLDAMRGPVLLSRAQLHHLGDRRFGVGADQILIVEPGPVPGIDFGFRRSSSAATAHAALCAMCTTTG